MKNSDQEALSAILDGESPEFEVRRVLVSLDADAAVSFSRWSLAGDVIRRQAVAEVPDSFSADLMARISGQEQAARHRSGLLPRTAVAATVALATLAGIQFWAGQDQAVDHFTALSASEQRLSDFTGEVSPVSQDLNAPKTASVTMEPEAAELQNNDNKPEATQILE